MPSHLDVIRNYFAAITRHGPLEDVARFLSPDIVQREFPNRFVPGDTTRSLKELREAAERRRAVIKEQRDEILSSVCEDDRVALEVRWTGILAIPVGKLAAGDAMRARSGLFFELRDGRIVR